MSDSSDAKAISAQQSQIIEAVKRNHFQLRGHATRRSDERLFTRESVMHIVATLISAKYQPEKYTHWFIGRLDDARGGGFTAIVDDGVWIVTVFKRRLSRRERGGPP